MGQFENRVTFNSGSDWSSSQGSSMQVEIHDEIDLAIQKCLEDQTSLKKLKIAKVSKGVYKLEQKEYSLRLL